MQKLDPAGSVEIGAWVPDELNIQLWAPSLALEPIGTHLKFHGRIEVRPARLRAVSVTGACGCDEPNPCDEHQSLRQAWSIHLFPRGKNRSSRLVDTRQHSRCRGPSKS